MSPLVCHAVLHVPCMLYYKYILKILPFVHCQLFTGIQIRIKIEQASPHFTVLGPAALIFFPLY